MSFENALADARARIDSYIALAMARAPESAVSDAMRYALDGGKCLRGFLVLESARLHGADPRQADAAGAAVEAMHAYSLVHDDLPCMDNDDLRRGRPTVHVAWDEAIALLVGDALQSFSYSLLCRADSQIPAEIRVELIGSLARAAGIDGMVLGQAQDIAAESAALPLSLEQIVELQKNKTGALIRWSSEAGPVLAGADQAPMTAYANALGLAFQIIDDVLDVAGDATKAGKRLRKDENAGKATFVSLLGLDGARARAGDLVDEACAALDPYGANGEILRQTARFVIAREY